MISATLRSLRQSGNMRLAAVLLCALIVSCAELQPKTSSPVTTGQNKPDVLPIPTTTVKDSKLVKDSESDLIRRAEIEHVHTLEREVARLKMDLVRAENTLIAVESKLRSGYSRATAVSALAEAQIQLNKASRVAPWRLETIGEARDKLDIAQKHIDEEYFGAAVFFVYRANRIVEDLNYEANIVDNSAQAMFINRPKVNLRSGPSTSEDIVKILVQGTPVVREKQKGEWFLVRTLTGTVGWVHRSLLTSKGRYKV